MRSIIEARIAKCDRRADIFRDFGILNNSGNPVLGIPKPNACKKFKDADA